MTLLPSGSVRLIHRSLRPSWRQSCAEMEDSDSMHSPNGDGEMYWPRSSKLGSEWIPELPRHATATIMRASGMGMPTVTTVDIHTRFAPWL
jgi:hypothetical protein